MVRELTDPDGDDILEWTEKVTDADGDQVAVSLELDAIDDGNGFTQEDTDSSNVPWLSYSTRTNLLPSGERETFMDIQADVTALTVGYTYRFEVTADDTISGPISRTFTLTIEPPPAFIYLINGGSNNRIEQYEMTSPFDASTASLLNTGPDIDDPNPPEGLTLGDSGNVLYVASADASGQNDGVYQYNFGTAYDVTTLPSTDDGFLDITSRSNRAVGAAVSPDGTQLITMGEPDFLEFSLSTPFDLTTGNFVQRDGSPPGFPAGGLSFANNGLILICGDSDGDVNTFDLGNAYTLDSVSARNSFNADGSATVVGTQYNDDGTKLFVVLSNGDVIEYTLSSAYDITSRTEESRNTLVGSPLGFFIT